jgi:hypothetical protein
MDCVATKQALWGIRVLKEGRGLMHLNCVRWIFYYGTSTIISGATTTHDGRKLATIRWCDCFIAPNYAVQDEFVFGGGWWWGRWSSTYYGIWGVFMGMTIVLRHPLLILQRWLWRRLAKRNCGPIDDVSNILITYKHWCYVICQMWACILRPNWT